jgi:exodeoxyribonuclease VII large subunit
VHRADGSLARSAPALEAGEAVRLEFSDGERAAVIDGEGGAAKRTPVKKAVAPPAGQGDLF